uniref:Uncharacterized protein n=1 Tax=viral metagenome TaxID=1070528 RepID=A0A6C0EFA0_9ZZZZ
MNNNISTIPSNYVNNIYTVQGEYINNSKVESIIETMDNIHPFSIIANAAKSYFNNSPITSPTPPTPPPN